MENVKIEKNGENTQTKVKAKAKAEVWDVILKALAAEYGEDKVSVVRTGTVQKGTNEICAIVGDAETEAGIVPICVGINPTVKQIETVKSAKKTIEAFNFPEAKALYEAKVKDTEEKEAAKAAKTEASAN